MLHGIAFSFENKDLRSHSCCHTDGWHKPYKIGKTCHTNWRQRSEKLVPLQCCSFCSTNSFPVLKEWTSFSDSFPPIFYAGSLGCPQSVVNFTEDENFIKSEFVSLFEHSSDRVAIGQRSKQPLTLHTGSSALGGLFSLFVQVVSIQTQVNARILNEDFSWLSLY